MDLDHLAVARVVQAVLALRGGGEDAAGVGDEHQRDGGQAAADHGLTRRQDAPRQCSSAVSREARRARTFA